MKKMLLATALACLLQDVLNRRLLFKTNRQLGAQNHHHHFFVSGIELTVDAAKICGGAENVDKASQQTFVNGCSVLLRAFTPLEARMCCSQ